MSLIADLTTAIVAELNAAEFSQQFTAQRRYLPRFDLAEMDDLHVTVVPKTMEVAHISRSEAVYELTVDVAVQKKVDPQDIETVDALMGLAEEIAVFFRGRRLTAFVSAASVQVRFEPIYAAEHLDQLRQFTSVVGLTFRVVQ